MADEVLESAQEKPEGQEVAVPAAGGEISVEIEPERKARPAINDDELAKMTSVNDDEISRANEDARKAVKSLRQAYQE